MNYKIYKYLLLHCKSIRNIYTVIAILLILANLLQFSPCFDNYEVFDKQQESSKLNTNFKNIAGEWLAAQNDVKTITEQNCAKIIDYFNKSNTTIILYNLDKIKYANKNIYLTSSELLKTADNGSQYRTYNNREVFITAIKEHGRTAVMVTIIPPDHIVKSSKKIVFDIFGALGILMLTIALQHAFYRKGAHKSKLNGYIYTLFGIYIVTMIMAHYMFSDNLSVWITAISSLIITKTIFNVVSRYQSKINIRPIYLLFVTFTAIFIILEIVYKVQFNDKASLLNIIPISLLVISFTKLLSVDDLLINTKRKDVPLIYHIAIFVIYSSLMIYQTDDIMTTVLIIILFLLVAIFTYQQRLREFTLLFFVALIASATSAYKLYYISMINKVLFEDNGYNFYERLTYKSSELDIPNEYNVLFAYCSVAIISIGYISIQRMFYKKIFGSITKKIKISFSLSLICVMLVSVYIRNSANNKVDISVINLTVDKLTSIVKNSYNNKHHISSDNKERNCKCKCDNCNITNNKQAWVDKLEIEHDIHIEIYNFEGKIIDSLNKNHSHEMYVPKKLNTNLVEAINNNNQEHIIRTEEHFSTHDKYSVCYTSLIDGSILRIMYNTDSLPNNYSNSITKLSDMLICCMLIMLMAIFIMYSIYSRPLDILDLSKFDIKHRRRIHIHTKDLSQVTSIITEYNDMIEELENQYKQQLIIERQQAWNRMTRVIAHEVKNLLTPMLLKNQMLLYKKEHEILNWQEMVDESCNCAITQTKRINLLMSNIMESPEKYINKDIQTSMNVLLDEMVKLHCANKIEFKVEQPEDQQEVIVNIAQEDMWSVVNNIVTNAVEAIKESCEKNGKITFYLRKNEHHCNLKIHNNGSIIDTEVLGKIFNYKFTTKPKGHGYGLYHSKNLINTVNGTFHVTSNENDGTTFEILIPLKKETFIDSDSNNE